jgi:hypothetical protein
MVKTVTNTVFIPGWNSSVIFVARQVDQNGCVGLASSCVVGRGSLSAGLK